ncbi:crossover junction endodeoxyribonuclease RuvC [Tumebacillus flagellatus]|uniref:Crossover junction endodeoxyribonuclease RuvC n=1 Tax=Tumebacillus flagellatus TaxID=1157490 RepID=A0A074LJ94_9BACL|nr:crossover junction endodeoxyribonuclease RuvC [Tumebacillus flagellatus]KEO82256.1 Holliday junction resolvase [Tumebacillus flagellatus]
MRILGIDPGYGRTGYGVVDSIGNRIKSVEYGCIETKPNTPIPDRLVDIYGAVCEVIARLKPEAVAVEQIFFSKSVTTALDVAQARGVVLLAAREAGLPVAEYTPMQVKQSVAGYGKADKKQMQEMVRMFLGLANIPKPDDAADALAVAITHAHNAPFLDRVERMKLK